MSLGWIGWVVGAFVVFILSAIYQRLYKQQDEVHRGLIRKVVSQKKVIRAAKDLEQASNKALVVMGQAMIKLSTSEELSREIETNYNRMNFTVGKFRETMEADRGIKRVQV
jgi:hypothetical protein